MVVFGFEEDIIKFNNELKGNSELGFPEEREKLKKAEKKFSEIRLTKERTEEFKKDFDIVVVHDYGDEYHLSEEERESKNAFYSAFKIVRKNKNKYRDIVQYVKAVRNVLKALDFVAENNNVYSPEKFKLLFLKGKINITGLNMPMYKGKDRKSFSWAYVVDFIFSDEPAENVIPKKENRYYTDEELKDENIRIFSEEELEELRKSPTDKEIYALEHHVAGLNDEMFPDTPTIPIIEGKEKKKLFNLCPTIIDGMKALKKEKNTLAGITAFTFQEDDMSAISKYDKLYNFKSKSDKPEFKGCMMNNRDIDRYIAELEDYNLDNTIENYDGRMRTLRQIQEIELKSALENNNWNIRKLYDNEERIRKAKRNEKLEKERERKLKAKLAAIQERNKERRSLSDGGKPIKSKKKKKDKVIHMNKKKLKAYKKDLNSQFDRLLLRNAKGKYDNFDDYENDALDFKWDFGGDKK